AAAGSGVDATGRTVRDARRTRERQRSGEKGCENDGAGARDSARARDGKGRRTAHGPDAITVPAKPRSPQSEVRKSNAPDPVSYPSSRLAFAVDWRASFGSHPQLRRDAGSLPRSWLVFEPGGGRARWAASSDPGQLLRDQRDFGGGLCTGALFS